MTVDTKTPLRVYITLGLSPLTVHLNMQVCLCHDCVHLLLDCSGLYNWTDRPSPLK